MSVLVTGGAGYIGGHMTLSLLDAGEKVVVVDNLSTGFAWAVPEAATLVVGDFGDRELISRLVAEHQVDAILASQVVTQKGSDIANFTALAERLEAAHLRGRILLLAGGPRVTNLLAAELGYDAGFGRGTLPSEVATFIARRIAERVAA